MKHLASVALLAALQAATAAIAQQLAAPAKPHPAAIMELTPRNSAPLIVTTPAFQSGGDIPFENTQYRGNVFPGLSWSAGPRGTKAYAIILQDTDSGGRPTPWLHWVLYNVPTSVISLAPGMASDRQPAGASYGPNYLGQNRPYLGPQTPPGPKHHYHFQVFAVDVVVPPDPAITYDTLVDALDGHVLASGEIIGMGELDPTWKRPS